MLNWGRGLVSNVSVLDHTLKEGNKRGDWMKQWLSRETVGLNIGGQERDAEANDMFHMGSDHATAHHLNEDANAAAAETEQAEGRLVAEAAAGHNLGEDANITAAKNLGEDANAAAAYNPGEDANAAATKEKTK